MVLSKARGGIEISRAFMNRRFNGKSRYCRTDGLLEGVDVFSEFELLAVPAFLSDEGNTCSLN